MTGDEARTELAASAGLSWGVRSRITPSSVTMSSAALSLAARGTNSRIESTTPTSTAVSRFTATPTTAVMMTSPASYREAFSA